MGIVMEEEKVMLRNLAMGDMDMEVMVMDMGVKVMEGMDTVVMDTVMEDMVVAMDPLNLRIQICKVWRWALSSFK